MLVLKTTMTAADVEQKVKIPTRHFFLRTRNYKLFKIIRRCILFAEISQYFSHAY